MNFIYDHITRALDRLIEQYKNKPKMSGYISALVKQVQLLESSSEELFDDNDIDNSIGAQLDGYGNIVGLPRVIGQDDDTYRALIKLKVIQNLNEGTAEEVIAAAKFFLSDPSILYFEVYPAAINIYTTVVLDDISAVRIRSQIAKFVPAGVSLDLLGYYDQNTFLFDLGYGFGDINDPSVGDLLANIYPDEVSLNNLLAENNLELMTESGINIIVEQDV